jgi:hypothetical protein
MTGDIYKASTPVSSYQPSKEVADFTSRVRKDFSAGIDILNKPWIELGDLSVIERMNRDQRTFNAFVDESCEDPSQAWKWRGTRSKARNKAIAMHAQLTAGYIIPMFLAQNDNDEEDRDMSNVMRDIAEWMVSNSNYKSSFLMTSMGMLVNPVTYLGAEYAQVFQKIKEKTEKGYTVTEILDEVLSGFQAPVYSADQILITNAYEQNIQRQRGIIKRRYIEYEEAEAKYGDHENWQFVQRGIKSVYSDDEGLFYDVKDDDHPNLVEEATPIYRRDDTEVCFLNGIYLGDEDVEANPIRHRDNRNSPKYNVVPFGYQRVNEHFFYYKSLMNSQYWDNRLLDAQYEVGMNRLFLDTDMPIAISGKDNIDSDIVFPSSVVAFADKDVKVTPLLPAANIGNLFAGMSTAEKSIDESSVSDVTGGQLPDANQKATALNIAERNARTLLQGVGKTLAESMVQYGGLMSDIAVQHLTVPQIMEIAGKEGKIKYPTFILDNKVSQGRNVSKVLRFDESLLGRTMSEDKKKEKEVELAMEAGYPEAKKIIYNINPELFSRMKYLVRIEPELMFPKNQEFLQAMMMEIQAQFQDNPYIDLEALTRKTLYQFFRGETDELMKKAEVGMENMNGILGGEGKGSAAGNMAKMKGLSTALPV